MKGRIEIIEFESECLKGNPLGDPHIREVCVYLPPNYDESNANFPTVYCLTGFTGRGKMLLNDNAFSPNIAERMDSLIASNSIKPMIIVMPDCFTKYGGSQYINSTATGNYEDYLTTEIVELIDKKYGTIADKNSRAMMGKSSGGYGALICGIRHADKFGLISSISGDAYFELCYLSDFPKAFRGIRGNPAKFTERFLGSEKQSKNDFPALNILGMSSCYSPNGSGFDLPFDLETGEIREDIWMKWLANDPVRLVENSVENLKSLRLLHLDAGTRDEFALDLGARILSKKLTSFGISHIHDEFDDGHFNISYRYNRSLELFSEHFSE